MSKENENQPATEAPVSPGIVKKASGSTANPKSKPAIPAVPAAQPAPKAQVETPNAPEAPATDNVFTIFGWDC